ncbi:transglutaminase domain-containing protein [Portibacter lacus]|uniref:Transglutaminase-like domain-containing protein n=1 Tax=Portibacter lacus TaxID=1099794 RepID=A0AA37STC1_9BACT|nr:transglutaminase domain-containing protein [Portibacter lacus]GLR17660.1 hypothetical protein GCM10007940_22750 [Portibacter lacus]
MKNIVSIILFLVLITPNGLSQELRLVDSIVTSYPSSGQTVKKLSKRINSSFKSDLEKVRAIYTWIALNVSYDIKESGKYNYTNFDEEERLVKDIKQTKKLSKRVISKRKAVCEGYASLFHELCIATGLESEIVLGNAKTNISQIGNSNRYNHAWNIVQIDNSKYLFDVTWDAIYEFKPNVTYRYFMTNPRIFIKNHFPKSSINQLIDKPVSQTAYANWPLFHMTSSTEEFEISPIQGILSKKENVNFEIRTINDTHLTSAGYSIGKQFVNVTDLINQNGNSINFSVEKEKLTNSKLTIFMNNKSVASYKLK